MWYVRRPMSETAVRVDLRQATLSESARLRETDGHAFLCLENPPPVRSLLRITIGDEQRAFEVGRVIEVVDDTETERGCHGTFVPLERLSEQLRVGSEHLQPHAAGSGVPAPVVIMNTNEMLLADDSLTAGRIVKDSGPIPSEQSGEQNISEQSGESDSEQTVSEQGSEQSASDFSASEQTASDTEID